MTQQIPLTRGQVALVNDDDYAWLTQYHWHCTSTGYAAARIKQNGKRRYIYMHRLLLDAQPGQFVDHIDGNRLNNTRDNLRFVTRLQNGWNRQRQSNMSGYKGVSWHDHHGKWQARIQHDGRQFFLGYFDDPVEAALAYDQAAEQHFGPFARKNFPSSA